MYALLGHRSVNLQACRSERKSRAYRSPTSPNGVGAVCWRPVKENPIMSDPQSLCDLLDGTRLMAHVRALARHVKLSGTPEEAKSLEYVQARMAEYGYRTKMLHHDAYISLPGAASVEADNRVLTAITHSFSRPSPAGGLTGALVDVGAGGEADFAGRDLRGCVLLIDGIATPGVALRASRAEAAGQLHVSPHAHLHEMCISPVWGSPTPESLASLPSTVVCTIAEADGAGLRARLRTGERPRVTLHATVETGWRKTPILVADLPGPDVDENAPFVLFSGHHDTWYFGVMDNGTANATMLELARLCAARRGEWRRGLRLCFWSGHSHGRFSGSSWYVDEHWDELDRRCVAHVNVDSPGAAGAEVLANTGAMAELAPLAAEALHKHAGQVHAGRRMPRGADMSFSGIGLPAIFGDLSEPASSAVAPHSWWWHTPEDLLDKVDETILTRDAKVVMHGLWRLLSDIVLPLDYAEHGRLLLAELGRLGAALEGRFELAGLIAAATTLRDRAAVVMQAGPGDAARTNRALMLVSRALVPMDYTEGDRFTHDPALPQPPWPVLQPLRALAATTPDSDAARFLTVQAMRSRNRLLHALRQANATLAETVVGGSFQHAH
jgi:hypothetical protein